MLHTEFSQSTLFKKKAEISVQDQDELEAWNEIQKKKNMKRINNRVEYWDNLTLEDKK